MIWLQKRGFDCYGMLGCVMVNYRYSKFLLDTEVGHLEMQFYAVGRTGDKKLNLIYAN